MASETTIVVLVSSATFVINLIVLAIAGVWIVAKIQASTEKLAVTIEHLADNVARQQKWLERIDHRVKDHGERIAVVETKTKGKQ